MDSQGVANLLASSPENQAQWIINNQSGIGDDTNAAVGYAMQASVDAASRFLSIVGPGMADLRVMTAQKAIDLWKRVLLGTSIHHDVREDGTLLVQMLQNIRVASAASQKSAFVP